MSKKLADHTFTQAERSERLDVRQSYAILALAYEHRESNNQKKEENRQRAISNKLELLKLLRDDGRVSEFSDMLEALMTEVL